jgi:hypothetical protein
MLITGVKLNESYFAYGRWDAGSIMITARPDFQLSYWDRLTLRNSTSRFSESVRRQPGTDSDTLKYVPLDVLYVVWSNRDREKTVYEKDTDFSLTEDENTLTWLLPARPDPNDRYAIVYTYRPRYTVLDLLHQHRESTVQGVHKAFPVQAVGKLDFLIRNEVKDAAPGHDPSPFREG